MKAKVFFKNGQNTIIKNNADTNETIKKLINTSRGLVELHIGDKILRWNEVTYIEFLGD